MEGRDGKPLAQHSVERLVHFKCTKCMKWWSISDAPAWRTWWWCPWCGEKLRQDCGADYSALGGTTPYY